MFVKNNRSDSRRSTLKKNCTPDWLLSFRAFTPSLQRELFRAALIHIGKRDLIRALLEVDLVGTTVICRECLYPLLPV
jgi:hypothetical protein